LKFTIIHLLIQQKIKMNFRIGSNYVFFTILYLTITLSGVAQNSNRIYKSFNENEDLLEVYTSDGTYRIKVYSEEIIETSFIPEGETFNPISHAVVLTPQKINTKVDESETNLIYSTTGISVNIDKNPFKIKYYYKGKFLVSEKEGYAKNQTGKMLNFNLDSTEVIYGGGERVIGMNHRGYRLQLYNRAHYGYTTHSELMNYTMPLVLSSKVYALHFDNAPIGYLDIDSKKDNTLTYETISGRMTYQVVASDTWTNLLDAYTDLTGKQPMIPRWALGNFSSRFGYHTEEETRTTVDKFIENKIPLDAVIIDIYWFGADIKGHMGNLEFLTDSFPTPDKMIADFKEKGVKTILVTEPFILTTSKKWNEVVSQNLLGTDSLGNPYRYDFYFGNTGLVDIFKPEGKEWFWNIYKKYTDRGIGGWWGDLGEPEVHPSGLQHATGSADEVHNIYGHEWAKLVYEGYQNEFPEQRPFILMRSGYSGSQHYGLIPWSGDVSRSWGGLQPQPEIALQMGIQGLGYMHSDLGGFAGGEHFDAELYTRWLQYGVFQPIYRPHAQEHIAAEPVYHDAQTMALAKKAIQLRYKLMPYNYTLVYENNQFGLPLMRPLFFEEQNNKEVYNVSDTYLWGDAFLVSPVLKAGLTSMEVYFPNNNNWFDFFSGQKYKGGSKQEVKVVSDRIPVFVRGGSFIPMAKLVQSTKDYSTSHLDVYFYYDEDVSTSTGSMYNDDGKTPEAYEKEKYEILNFKSEINNNSLKIEFVAETGANYVPMKRDLNLMVHNVTNKPKRVIISNKKIDYKWDEEKQKLSIPFEWDGENKLTVEVGLR
jgi:oligosaccharide 4-alpha-D-glucosyltransferase